MSDEPIYKSTTSFSELRHDPAAPAKACGKPSGSEYPPTLSAWGVNTLRERHGPICAEYRFGTVLRVQRPPELAQ